MTTTHYRSAGFAVPEDLTTLHDLLARVGADHLHLNATDLMLFETAVIEIAGNVAEHGGRSQGVSWTFTLDVSADRLEGVLVDDGLALVADPSAADLPEDALAESGRGLALARAALDELSYDRSGSTNRWLMVRRLRS